jgi:hypothetical protein
MTDDDHDQPTVEWYYDPHERFSTECEYCPAVEAEIIIELRRLIIREYHRPGCPFVEWFNRADPGEPPPWEIAQVLNEAEAATHIIDN